VDGRILPVRFEFLSDIAGRSKDDITLSQWSSFRLAKIQEFAVTVRRNNKVIGEIFQTLLCFFVFETFSHIPVKSF
jgi:hypothetical protein